MCGFERLVIWQRARQLSHKIREVAKSFRDDAYLGDQMRRAAISIASNIAEGSERGSAADFRRFLIMAKASCGELRSHLYLALDDHHIDTQRFHELLNDVSVLGRMMTAFIQSMKR
ncbi:MAG: four helix bundle protein [Planctomycetes bacterium]|nr:four helix bundle protein [Planctomycetota bacterium]